jgi:hypothetical protein
MSRWGASALLLHRDYTPVGLTLFQNFEGELFGVTELPGAQRRAACLNWW